ncbi:MAG TPA: alpha/beta hydrolase [Ilumatobacteraceae bacterium]|nr:alpha/beta hydrolase [Ilumatobacteraceae bacterium]
MHLPDEFEFLADNAAEVGMSLAPDVAVRRCGLDLADGQHVSGVRWGTGPVELVYLHGGAQNAHTWDSVALALGRPAIAIDLPGHGYSNGEGFDRLDIAQQALTMVTVLEHVVPAPVAVIGMSLGGLVALAVSATRADLVPRLVLVDILPSSSNHRTARMNSFLDGKDAFDSFEEMVEWSVLHNPGRSAAELRRGVFHNAQRGADGRWTWRHTRDVPGVARIQEPEFRGATASLWPAVASFGGPLMLAYGGTDASVLREEHVQMLRERQPAARVERVQGAGHSVQRSRPRELAALIADFLGDA